MTIPLREVPVLDGNAEGLGVSTRTLMENAGTAVAEAVAERDPGGVAVLAGPGNNGGDGLVAARTLADGTDVTVLTPARETGIKTRLTREAFDDLPEAVDVELDRTALDADDLAGFDVLVDALLGAGLEGDLRDPYRGYVEAANEAEGWTVSVDTPTGLGTDLQVEPDATVTFHDRKEGMTAGNSGEIRVADVGVPERAETHTGPGEFALYPEAPRDQHKGQGGFVLVIGGGPYHGAPALCGLAAMRSGADLSIVLTPERAASAVEATSPNLVVRHLKGDDLDFEEPQNRVTLNLWLKKADSVVVGPGLGRFNVTKQSIHHTVERARESGIPTVVDADALWAMGEHLEMLGERCVVTPHAAEYEELTGRQAPAGPDSRADLARKFASKTGATLLFKGPTDVVANADRVKRNDAGTPAMSTGGTGDVLAGVVGALLAKGLDPFDAARLGAYATGRAGEEAFEAASYGLLASDVVDEIPRLLRQHLAPDGR
jgi:NAD(P)H-hydrate epimerase